MKLWHCLAVFVGGAIVVATLGILFPASESMEQGDPLMVMGGSDQPSPHYEPSTAEERAQAEARAEKEQLEKKALDAERLEWAERNCERRELTMTGPNVTLQGRVFLVVVSSGDAAHGVQAGSGSAVTVDEGGQIVFFDKQGQDNLTLTAGSPPASLGHVVYYIRGARDAPPEPF